MLLGLQCSSTCFLLCSAKDRWEMWDAKDSKICKRCGNMSTICNFCLPYEYMSNFWVNHPFKEALRLFIEMSLLNTDQMLLKRCSNRGIGTKKQHEISLKHCLNHLYFIIIYSYRFVLYYKFIHFMFPPIFKISYLKQLFCNIISENV